VDHFDGETLSNTTKDARRRIFDEVINVE